MKKELLFLVFTLLFLISIPASVCSQTNHYRNSCDAFKTPIVFVHGFLGSGDNWAKQVQRFSSNGYCDDRMFLFDWNTINRNRATDSLLDIFINDVLKKTKSSKVELVGHSAGGGLCYSYLNNEQHAFKVAHYVHIGSSKMKTAAGKNGEVPTMNIYSKGDYVIKTGGDIPGAVNVVLAEADHMQTATSEETFLALYQFFNDNRKPATSSIIPAVNQNAAVLISGRGVTLGENDPLTNDTMYAYAFNATTGKREYAIKRQAPGSSLSWMQFTKNGDWKLLVSPKYHHEIEIRPVKGRKLFYFFEPQQRTNKAVYLRAFPLTGMMTGVLNQLPKDEQQTVLVIFASGQAIVAGRDTLAIDSIPLSTGTIAPASKTMISAFVFDDGDGKSGLQPVKLFGNFPFLGSIDLKIPADDNGTMRIYFNGRSMLLPRRPSSEGIMIAVFN